MKINFIFLHFFVPFSFYLLFFIILTFPLILNFNTSLFAEYGDGFQHAWNLWWVNESLINLHKSPFFTTYIEFPWGTTLLGHTLNPLNGFIAIVFLKFLSLVQTYNLILILTFVLSGYFMFLLAYYFSKSYFGSLIAGYIYTFSNFHFAHAKGHLELISIELLPLLFLAWFRFLEPLWLNDRKLLTSKKKQFKWAVFLAFLLVGQFYLSIYYFVYICLALLFSLLFISSKNELINFIKYNFYPFAVIFLILGLFVGPFIYSFIGINLKDPFEGWHPSIMFSTDLIAPFLPGGVSLFSDLTKFTWINWSGNVWENSVYIGFVPLGLTCFVWKSRKKIKNSVVSYWFFLAFAFFILSLGPVLQINGHRISFLRLPYSFLEMIPGFELSGVPVRMMVIVLLCFAVISSFGFKLLFKNDKENLIFAGILFLFLVFEYFPGRFSYTKIIVPDYVVFLKNLHASEKGLIDLTSNGYNAMFYNTVHNIPIAFGFVSRYPYSVLYNNVNLATTIKNREYSTLCRVYDFEYFALKKSEILSSDVTRIIYKDSDTIILDLCENET